VLATKGSALNTKEVDLTANYTLCQASQEMQIIRRKNSSCTHLSVGHDSGHEAVSLRLVGVDHLAREDHLHRLGLADRADQALGAATT